MDPLHLLALAALSLSSSGSTISRWAGTGRWRACGPSPTPTLGCLTSSQGPRFDPDANSPIESMPNCRVPVIFFHGEDDGFVPCYMSREVYDACTAPKKLVTVHGADHGLVYLVDNRTYFRSVVEFFSENGVETKLVSRL